MENYIKTIINGLKAWVSSGLNKVEASVSKLSGNLETLGSKITSLTSKVTENTKDIAELQEYEDETYGIATNAQTTADNAQTTANAAQTTANTAQATANTAQATANTAQATANTAQTTANTANKAANVKWDSGMLGCIYNAGTNGTTMVPHIYATAPIEGSSIIYLLVASFKGTATSLTGITSIYIGSMYASFGESVTINQFDILKITMSAGATVWQAEKTEINLGANALVTALSEVYEE